MKHSINYVFSDESQSWFTINYNIFGVVNGEPTIVKTDQFCAVGADAAAFVGLDKDSAEFLAALEAHLSE